MYTFTTFIVIVYNKYYDDDKTIIMNTIDNNRIVMNVKIQKIILNMTSSKDQLE